MSYVNVNFVVVMNNTIHRQKNNVMFCCGHQKYNSLIDKTIYHIAPPKVLSA
jgi:hypothetical protein